MHAIAGSTSTSRCVFAAKYTARRVRRRSLRRLELVAGRCISEIRHVFSTLRVLDSFRRDPTTSLFSLHWRIHSAMGALRRPILVHYCTVATEQHSGITSGPPTTSQALSYRRNYG